MNLVYLQTLDPSLSVNVSRSIHRIGLRLEFFPVAPICTISTDGRNHFRTALSKQVRRLAVLRGFWNPIYLYVVSGQPLHQISYFFLRVVHSVASLPTNVERWLSASVRQLLVVSKHSEVSAQMVSSVRFSAICSITVACVLAESWATTSSTVVVLASATANSTSLIVSSLSTERTFICFSACLTDWFCDDVIIPFYLVNMSTKRSHMWKNKGTSGKSVELRLTSYFLRPVT